MKSVGQWNHSAVIQCSHVEGELCACFFVVVGVGSYVFLEQGAGISLVCRPEQRKNNIKICFTIYPLLLV